jgi:hypothetical protein
MANTIAYGRALFYPHIDFHDEKWLKTAALYYKGLDRIVPEGYSDFEDPTILKRLNENEKFVTNINPREASEEVAMDFLDFARDELTDEEHRRKLITSVGSNLPVTQPYKVHMKKIGKALKNDLPELGLAVENKGTDWYEFEPVTGAMYMTCLANHLAAKARIPVVTDDPAFQPLIRAIQIDRFPGNTDIGESLASMVIRSSVPKDLDNIPISKIIEFRKRYDGERTLFYNEVNKLVKDLETIDSEDALEEALDTRRKEIDHAVENLDKAFLGMGISTTVAMLGLSIPSFASGLGPLVVAGSVITLAIGKLVNQGIDYHRTKKSSPYSYVLSLKRKLSSETFAEQMLNGSIIF